MKDLHTKGGRKSARPNADATVNFCLEKICGNGEGGQKQSNLADVLYGWLLILIKKMDPIKPCLGFARPKNCNITKNININKNNITNNNITNNITNKIIYDIYTTMF